MTFPTGEPMYALAAGDFNGDGKTDLVGPGSAQSGSQAANLFFGDGSGHFSAAVPYGIRGSAVTVTTADLTGGSRPSVVWAGNPGVGVLVNVPGATTTLRASASRSIAGQPVTLTATVRPDDPAGGTPTGSVTFADGGTVLGTAPLVGGTATLTTAAASVGRRVLTATYSGGNSFPAALGLLVLPPPSTPAVFDPGTATWYLRNQASAGAPSVAPFAFGGPGWTPVLGDWDGNGTTTLGVVDHSTMTWYLRNSASEVASTPSRFSAARGLADEQLAGRGVATDRG
jgi:Bacterial Ig-like domain (group 3)/FG-GAP repeat